MTTLMLLRYLGIFGTLKGYYYFLTAVGLSTREPGRKLQVTKEIYPVVAKIHNVTPSQVERAMRTAMEHSWQQCPERVEEIAGCTLTKKPTTSLFLDILSEFILKNK